VLHEVAAQNKGAEIASHFAVAIQEWKNALLRGSDPKDLEKYWSSHQKEMGEVNARILELDNLVDAQSATRPLVTRLGTEMQAAQAGYNAAFESFKAAGNDPTAGDKAAKGKDRAAVATLNELRSALTQAETASSEAATSGARTATRVALATLVLVSLAAMAGSIWLSRQISGALQKAVDLADQVAHGNLSTSVQAQGHDEIAALMRSLGSMQDKLAALVGHVRQGSESVANASSEIAQGNNDLSARTEQQAAALQQTASSMAELGATVSHSADNARQANQLAANASSVALRGGEVMGQVVETMKGINDSSRKIADIISVIDGIAFQTNILALNAAVEAARAGEQGRGFAVVASEVRALAGRSAEAAREIKSLIGASVERVEHGSALVDQAGATMNDVVTAIRRVSDIVGEISSATSEQSAGVTQVGQSIAQIDQSTQQNAALVEEMAAAASSLSGQASDLVTSVSTFKLQAGAQALAAPRRVKAPIPAARPNLASRPAPRQLSSAPVKTLARPVAPKTAAAPAKARLAAPTPKPAAPKPAAPAPKATAAADDEWETF
jgi:methyl-accepting chemotaxis protein